MVNKLTQEQLEKAAEKAHHAVGERECNGCEKELRTALGRGSVETMLEAAAPHLQYAREAPQDVVEAMLDAFFASHPNDPWRKYCESDRKMFRRDMTAAFHVCAAWCRERMLADPTSKEAKEAQAGYNAGMCMADVLNSFVHDRRAQPLLPEKTVEERVTVDEVHTTPLNYSPNCAFSCHIDGKPAGPLHSKREYAEIYRLGLISQLKQEGR